MQNPFFKPCTVAQWLVGSVCWISSVLGIWLLAIWIDSKIFPQSELLAPIIVLGGYIVVNWLIWQEVVVKGWRLLVADSTEPVIILAVALLWMLLLNGMQIYAILLMSFGVLFALGGGMQF